MSERHEDELDPSIHDPAHEEHHQALRGQAEALLRELAAARPASAASGSEGAEVTAEMRRLVEDALGSAGSEMVSFGVGAAPSAELVSLHAKVICGIVGFAAGSRDYRHTQEAIDYVKGALRPDDVPADGKFTTPAQLANWCVRQMAFACQRGDQGHLYLVLLFFWISHGSVWGQGGIWLSTLGRIAPLDKETVWQNLSASARDAYMQQAWVFHDSGKSGVDHSVIVETAKQTAVGELEKMRADALESLILWSSAQLRGTTASTNAAGRFGATVDGVNTIFGVDGKRYLELVQALQG